MHSLVRKFLDLIKKIATLHSSPRQIAGSVALGAFVGSIPISGMQTLIAILLSIILRVNKVGAVVSMQIYCNPLTLPFIFFIDYKIGRLLLRHHDRGITPDLFRGLSPEKIIHIAKPLFLGSLVLACAVAPLAYAGTLLAIHLHRKV